MNNDTHFDFVILGTGLSESILSAMLAQSGYKVLQLDASDQYGSSLKTFNYVDFCEAHNKKPKDSIKSMSRDFNIDYTPKVLLSGGLTQKCLIDFKLTVLVNFLLVPGSYIYKNKLYEIPTSESKSLKTSLISFLQKPRVIKFFYNVRKYHQGYEITMKPTMRDQFKYYSINDDSAQIIGHGIALFTDDSYLDMSPKITFDRIRLYIDALTINNTETSAFIYPIYGVSELCQAFVRKAALAGAILRLRCDIASIIQLTGKNDSEKNNYKETKPKTVVIERTEQTIHNKILDKSEFNEETLKIQVESLKIDQEKDYKFEITIKPREAEESKIYAKAIISTPEYHHKMKNLVKKQPLFTIIRATLIVEGPCPLLLRVPSAQILFLSSGLNRMSDVFTLILGHRECVAPKGFKVILISYKKEGDGDQTIQKIINLFGNIVDSFVREEEIFDSTGSDTDSWYTVKGSDESMHFENEMEEVAEMIDLLRKDGFRINSSFDKS